MAYCFSFMFQFDGQDVLVPYTHYQRNKGIGSKYYLRGTIYSVRSNELTKMQESSCPVLLRSFVQALYSQEPRFETEKLGKQKQNSEWEGEGGGEGLRELVLAQDAAFALRSPRVAHKATKPFDMFFTK